MMHALVGTGLSNALVAIVLAAAVAIVTRLWRSAPLAHALWLLVLLKLVSPSLLGVALPLLGGAASPVQQVRNAELNVPDFDVRAPATSIEDMELRKVAPVDLPALSAPQELPDPLTAVDEDHTEANPSPPPTVNPYAVEAPAASNGSRAVTRDGRARCDHADGDPTGGRQSRPAVAILAPRVALDRGRVAGRRGDLVLRRRASIASLPAVAREDRFRIGCLARRGGSACRGNGIARRARRALGQRGDPSARLGGSWSSLVAAAARVACAPRRRRTRDLAGSRACSPVPPRSLGPLVGDCRGGAVLVEPGGLVRSAAIAHSGRGLLRRLGCAAVSRARAGLRASHVEDG